MQYPYVARVACHHDCWSNPSEIAPEVLLDVFGIACNENSAFAMVKMNGEEEQKKQLYDRIKNHPHVLECKKKSKDYFFVRVNRGNSFYAKLVDYNCVVDNSVPIQDGVETERIFGFSKKALMDSLSRIKEEREVKVLSIQPITGFMLTPKEQELLNLAMRKGYYEIPRKSYAVELGEELGLKKSVVLDRLRKIEKKIVENYYCQS